MKYQPLFGRVILRDVPTENKTESGIVLLTEEPFKKAIVVAVAPDVKEVEPTDVVYYEGGTFPVKDGKDEYGLIRVEQIAYICIPCSGKKSTE